MNPAIALPGRKAEEICVGTDTAYLRLVSTPVGLMGDREVAPVGPEWMTVAPGRGRADLLAQALSFNQELIEGPSKAAQTAWRGVFHARIVCNDHSGNSAPRIGALALH
jgi:hypothetical protein